MGRKKHKNGDAEPTVEDVMTPIPTCCHPDTSLHEAAALLWNENIGALPVVNGTTGKQVSAMITDRDIAMAAYTRARPLHELRVRDACNGPARTCRPSDGLGRALELMTDTAVRRLVVVNVANQPIGVISLSDIAQAASAPMNRRKKLERATCRALAAITSSPNDTSPTEKALPDAVPHSLL